MGYFDVKGEQLIARRGYSGTGNWLGDAVSKIGGLLKDAGGAVVKTYGAAQQQAGQAQAYQQVAMQAVQPKPASGLPSWALPVGIGVAGLAAVFLLTRKKRNLGRRNPVGGSKRRKKGVKFDDWSIQVFDEKPGGGGRWKTIDEARSRSEAEQLASDTRRVAHSPVRMVPRR